MRFRLFDIEFYVSFWFFAVLALFAALDVGPLLLYFALPVLLHELGHAAAIGICGAKIKTARFMAFGVEIARGGGAPLSFGRELAIALSGPAVNLILAACVRLFAFPSMRAMLFAAANAAIALFNLLPIGRLDGGSIARLFAERFFMPRLSYILSRAFSFAALVPLFAAAIFLILRPERNFTLLIVCVYLLLDIIFCD